MRGLSGALCRNIIMVQVEPARAGKERHMAEQPKGDAGAGGVNAYAQYHEVQKGETLGKIARKYYGDASLYKTIFDANKDLLKDPDKIFPGQKLRIP
ncbi:MAG: LysM peptidoglycan-binding domain-containing protein [Gammaproteobacteria bacterium]|nr:LysM peptidoglycan-binding domain-containing protein [Gammaproteobacteria bacterium]